jgi:hypothetical protein
MPFLKNVLSTFILILSFASLKCMEQEKQSLYKSISTNEILGHIFQSLGYISSQEIKELGAHRAIERVIQGIHSFLQTCKAWHVFYDDKAFNGLLIQHLAHAEFFPSQVQLLCSLQVAPHSTEVERKAIQEQLIKQYIVYPLTYVTFLLNTKGAYEWTKDYLKAHPSAMIYAMRELIRVIYNHMHTIELQSERGKINLNKTFLYILCLLKLNVSPCRSFNDLKSAALEIAYMYYYGEKLSEHHLVQKIQQLLLKYAKKSFDIQDKKGYTFLMKVLKQPFCYNLAIDLIKSGADTTKQTLKGKTALSIALCDQTIKSEDYTYECQEGIQHIIELLKQNTPLSS